MTAPAGWYEDPNDKTRARYWDGSDWGATRPLPPKVQSDPRDHKVTPIDIAMAVLIPFVGVIIAIAGYARGRTHFGNAILLTSILAFLAWGALLMP